MAASASIDVAFNSALGEPVGGAGAYLQRPGFWQGGAGIAACWHGGAVALARTLLAHSALPIGEVASRCGYQDQGAFAERFLAETGLTPSRWRQQNGPQP